MSRLTAAFVSDPVELRPNATEDNIQSVIRAVYKQVLGNAHLLDNDRLISAESLLRNGDITVRGFVRMVAQSELYQSRFFSSSSPYRFIELNCKHLLGRAPLNQAEISQHVQTYNSQGYEAEINSYIDSEEYTDNFGENVVPYPRSIRSQAGINNNVFNRTVSLLGGYASSSDSSKGAKLISTIASNLPQKIKVSSAGVGAYSSTGKRFRVCFSNVRSANTRFSNASVEVGYAQLSQKVQSIQRTGGKILSVTQIS